VEDPIVPFDLTRMFLGTDPALFYFEIIFRTGVVYAYALALIRWVGGRTVAQMSTVEFLLVIALGSSVGDAMFYPEVPLFHAMLVITVVVVINKALDILIFRYKSVEKLIDGKTAEVIRNGVANMQTLRHRNIGTSELFEALRNDGFVNLGEVRQGYLESSGSFSFFQAKSPQPGLPIEPAWDVYPPETYGPREVVDEGPLACRDCGLVIEPRGRTPDICGNCDSRCWTAATLPLESNAA